jgi:hypothetical protein
VQFRQVTGKSVIVRVVPEPEPLAVVIGRNCRRIRSELDTTQDGLARSARAVGLRWTASSVGDFEAGRSSPTFATVLAVTAALQRAWIFQMFQRSNAAQMNGQPRPVPPNAGVTVADLLGGGDGSVLLTDTLAVPAAAVADMCRGIPFGVLTADDDAHEPPGGPAAVLLRSGLTEHRLAQRLGVTPVKVADQSFLLWQSTFSEERDRRAGPDANQQKRGRISRELRTELEEAIANGDHQ